MNRKIKELLKYCTALLEESGCQSPSLDAEVLMAFLLKQERSYLFMYPEKELSESIYKNYLSIIEERRKGKPVAYITNQQEFMGIDFYVNEHVLIPRPDTEILVESVLSIVKNNTSFDILDLGSGSGAISVSLAYYLPNAHVYGVDIQKDALMISKENAKKQGVEDRMHFFYGDLFEPLPKKKTFDIIVSNPPYIARGEIEKLQIEVSSFEPLTALDGGIDGLDFYRKIITDASNYIKENGYLFFEIGYNQAQDVTSLLSNNKAYSEIEIIKDLAGLDRVVKSRIHVI